MSVVRVGATKQYSDNWDTLFSGGRSSSFTKRSAKKTAKKSPKKTAKAARKAAGKKSPAGSNRKRK
jgi:hypothetical protein